MSETDAPHAGFHCDDFPLAIGQDAPALGELSLLRVDSRHIVEVTDLVIPLNSEFTGHPETIPPYQQRAQEVPFGGNFKIA